MGWDERADDPIDLVLTDLGLWEVELGLPGETVGP